ncbi:MAG: hypothetical protein SGJ17_03515 [Hyphomicrobiales bacterium]|nr:hypothetical protein [Hyphomicrobiales bacterium]
MPTATQRLAAKNVQLLKANPRHPSIQFKKVGVLWSARVGRDYRALATEEVNGYSWFWIGAHAEYDALLK